MSAIVVLKRGAAGLRVAIEPPVFPLAELGKTFILPTGSNRRFSRAAGYACGLAARYNLKFEDRTGRLSAADCAALVEAQRATG